jgi:hypothetical protein
MDPSTAALAAAASVVGTVHWLRARKAHTPKVTSGYAWLVCP